MRLIVFRQVNIVYALASASVSTARCRIFHRDAISGEEGYEWLKKILAHNPKSVVLFITAYVDTEKAVRAIKAGAIDFIPKPWDRNKLLDTVKSAVELSRERYLDSSDSQEKESEQKLNMNQCSDSKSVVSSQDVFAGMIGECSAMKELKAQMMRVAATDANVLITGENGTGKDVVAHALHQLSGRARKPFVNIDLGCIPENLFESELFGKQTKETSLQEERDTVAYLFLAIRNVLHAGDIVSSI